MRGKKRGGSVLPPPASGVGSRLRASHQITRLADGPSVSSTTTKAREMPNPASPKCIRDIDLNCLSISEVLAAQKSQRIPEVALLAIGNYIWKTEYPDSYSTGRSG